MAGIQQSLKCLLYYVTVQHKSGLRSKRWVYNVPLPPSPPPRLSGFDHKSSQHSSCFCLVCFEEICVPFHETLRYKSDHVDLVSGSFPDIRSYPPGNTLRPSCLIVITIFLVLLFSIFMLSGRRTKYFSTPPDVSRLK